MILLCCEWHGHSLCSATRNISN